MPRRRKLEFTRPWPPLETARLILRPFRAEDLNDLHAYVSDPKVCRFMTWGPNTPEESRKFLDGKLEQQTQWPRASVSVAAELRAERRVIGTVELKIVDTEHWTAEFGYAFASRWWNQGFGEEAARALIDHGFSALGVRRTIATCDMRNKGSWRVMEKLGMRREGAFLKDVPGRRGWRDSYLYAVLRDEWG
jgi:RimJ/RimL family protein N-acetyltransferase